MELYQLKTFVVVAEEGHLSRAAERLFVSQPAVSAHIKALEEELEVKLFIRSSRGMELTRQGQELKLKAEQALNAASEILFTAKALKRELMGKLHVGLNTDSDFLKIGSLVSILTERFPQLTLSLEDSVTGKIIADVAQEKIDAGFVFGEVGLPEIETLELTGFTIFIAGPAAWEEQLKDASWQELAAMPWIWTPAHCPYHHMAHNMFASRKLTPAKVIEANGEHLLRSLVAGGKGLTLMREDEVERGRAAGEIITWPGQSFRLPAQFIHLASRATDPLILALKGAVMTAWGLDETQGETDQKPTDISIET
ncbi:MAG: LysR family transcriptional regulator [Proteobacteria bacterium]|nr:LysR family transcriptional regulator [Pseudomonadota bacterium]